VDDVAVQEQTSDGTFGGVCSGGVVYNLEVECEHNYFANGILVHNCHHSTAPQWGESIATCLGAVWGFTATPETGNDERDTMFQDFWRDIHTISRASVIHTLSSASVVWLDASDIMAGQIVEAETDKMVRWRGKFFKGDEGQLWGQCAWLCAVEHGIVKNQERNKAAIKAALSHSEPTLVLVNQVEHAQWMADQLLGAVACYAAMGKKKRKQTMDDFRSGKLNRVVSTSLFDEGADVPRIEVLIMVSGGRSEVKTIQRTGRALRICEGKKGAIIYDFKDTFHGLMRKHAQKRRDIYAELGYKQA
jgi:superfamily II DNA or RNA helicase